MTCQVERHCCLPISRARGMNGQERNDLQLQYQKSCCSCSTTSQATPSYLTCSFPLPASHQESVMANKEQDES
eukprot:scaffold39895_cov155-Skeletonema_dohrnii-CCMP3373.AAC.1